MTFTTHHFEGGFSSWLFCLRAGHMDRSDEVASLREEVSRLRHQVAILQGDLSGAHLTTEGLLMRALALEHSSSGHTVRLSDMEADLELCNTRLAEVQASLCAVIQGIGSVLCSMLQQLGNRP